MVELEPGIASSSSAYFTQHGERVTSALDAAVNAIFREKPHDPIEAIAFHPIGTRAASGTLAIKSASTREINSVRVNTPALSAAKSLRELIPNASKELMPSLVSILMNLESAATSSAVEHINCKQQPIEPQPRHNPSTRTAIKARSACRFC